MDPKSLFASKTFWSAMLGIAAHFFPAVAGINPDATAYHAANLIELFAFGGTIAGRLLAKRPVTVTGAPK